MKKGMGILLGLLISLMGMCQTQVVHLTQLDTAVVKTLSGMSSKVYYMSQTGATSGADLSIGSTYYGEGSSVAANNAAVIQNLLNTAGPNSNVTLINDGAYAITQLKVKGNTTIQCFPGCGFIQPPNTSKQMLTNYNRSGTSILDENITIDGGIWNQSGYVGSDYGQAKTDGSNGWNIIFRFSGVRRLRVKNITFVNPRTFCSFVNNMENVLYENIECRVAINAPFGNFDGCKFIHGKNISIRNVVGATKDDIVSIGSNDNFHPSSLPNGMSDTQGGVDFSASYGDITDVLIENLKLDASQCGIRLLSSTHKIDRVTIRGYKGTQNYGLSMICDNFTFGGSPLFADATYGATTGPRLGYVGTLTLEDIDVTNTGENYDQGQFYIGLQVENLVLKNVVRTDFTREEPLLYIKPTAHVKNLTINGLIGNNTLNSLPLIKVSGVVDNLILDGAVYNRPGYEAFNTTGVVQLVGGGIINNMVQNPGYVVASGEVTDASIKIGMMSLWKMEETSGNFLDAVGSYPLTKVNGTTSTTGLFGNAATFNAASNQYLTGSSSLTHSNAGFTMSGMFKLNTTSAAYQHLFIKGLDGDNTHQFACYYEKSSGKVKFNMHHTGQIQTSPATEVETTMPMDQWVYIQVRWDTQNMSLKVGNSAPVSAAFASPAYSSSTPLVIGASADNGLTLSGQIDNLKFWNRPITTAETTYDSNGGAGRNY